MSNENTGYAEQQDMTVELSKLVEAGLNEAQIARFARLRANYSYNYDKVASKAVEITAEEQNKLNFLQWLYNSGRLAS